MRVSQQVPGQSGIRPTAGQPEVDICMEQQGDTGKKKYQQQQPWKH